MNENVYLYMILAVEENGTVDVSYCHSLENLKEWEIYFNRTYPEAKIIKRRFVETFFD